jgi:hypothetical protein
METDGQLPGKVIDWLRQAGLAEFTAVVLEAAGPLTFLGAQAILFLEPLVSSRGSSVGELARTLEDPDQVADLVQRLRSQGGTT